MNSHAFGETVVVSGVSAYALAGDHSMFAHLLSVASLKVEEREEERGQPAQQAVVAVSSNECPLIRLIGGNQTLPHLQRSKQLIIVFLDDITRWPTPSVPSVGLTRAQVAPRWP